MHQYAHGIPSFNLEKLESKLFLPRPTVQIANVSPFCWKIVKTKFFTSPTIETHLPLLLHFFYLAQNLLLYPSNLSLPSRLYFSLLFLIFSFLPHLLTNQFKIQKKKKTHTLGLIVSPPINTPMSKKMAYLAHELYY
jgi:hypothetical protein